FTRIYFSTIEGKASMGWGKMVAYLSLRVAVEQIKCQRVRSLPPTRPGPLSIQASHLKVHCSFGSPGAAETADLPKLATQFAVGAFQQRGRSHHFVHHPLQRIGADRLLPPPAQRWQRPVAAWLASA